MVSSTPTLMIPPRWTLSTLMISETSGSMSAGGRMAIRKVTRPSAISLSVRKAVSEVAKIREGKCREERPERNVPGKPHGVVVPEPQHRLAQHPASGPPALTVEQVLRVLAEDAVRPPILPCCLSHSLLVHHPLSSASELTWRSRGRRARQVAEEVARSALRMASSP